MANFEIFQRPMAPFKADPFVTIHKRGTMSLNRAAFLALDSPASIELLYDREKTVIGIHPIDPRAETAYHVRATVASGPFVVSAMAFTKFYELDRSISRRWPAYLEAGVLCVDLTQPGVPVTSNRARKDPPGADTSGWTQ